MHVPALDLARADEHHAARLQHMVDEIDHVLAASALDQQKQVEIDPLGAGQCTGRVPSQLGEREHLDAEAGQTRVVKTDVLNVQFSVHGVV